MGTKEKSKKESGEAEVLEKIAEMEAPYRDMGERLHEIITDSAPELTLRTWYGMPAYAKDGKVVCFFNAEKGYMSFALTEDANLSPAEDTPHQLIESSWYFTELDDATEEKLSDIVSKAAN